MTDTSRSYLCSGHPGMSGRKPLVVVTGASKGIGLAVTKLLLHKFNANVVAISRTRTPELLELTSSSLLSIECDVTNETDLIHAISFTEKTYHQIDGLILNAGTLEPMCHIGDDTPMDAWKAHFDINFFSLITALKAAIPSLRKSDQGGRVIFVSSGASIKGIPGWGPYCAAKAAMNGLCRTLAEEEPDIVSIALRPGVVDTNMQAVLRETGGSHMSDADHQNFLRLHSEGKLTKPEDPGHVIAALSLRAPKKLSGQFISWDSDDCKEFRMKRM